jgi:ABC-type transport system involved in multi-copper enzyme maturation permease subunit
MSTVTLAAPIPMDTTWVTTRPGLGRLVAVELRKIVDTRAGFWMQVATVVLTALVVIARVAVGDASDHTFASVLDAGVFPAAVLLPVAGILLVTSEWSQRTGMITFALVPVRSRVLGAKLVASLILAVAMLAVTVAIVALGVLVGGAGVDGAWADAGTLIAQSAVYLGAGMLTGVAFGMVVLASAPAIVALFALPIAWTGLASLSFLADAAPWLDTRLSLGPLTQEVLGGAQWAHVGTSLLVWMVLPLLVGTWRITRREVAG